MQKLVELRHQPVRTRLAEIRKKSSMLHEDVLLLIYHLAKETSGNIFEIGPYLGGSTIAAALGIRECGRSKRIVTVERGGAHKHPRLPSRNIIADLKKNLREEEVSDLIWLVEEQSTEPNVIQKVREILPARSVGLFIFDADAGIDSNLEVYGDLLTDCAWLIIDDYYSPKSAGKATLIKPRVDSFVESGRLVPLGLYGWGTWVGRYTSSRADAPRFA
jgi:predicted O-methyltransferase YrrM